MTLSQEAGRLGRVLADRSRKQEMYAANGGADICVNGATFDLKQFQDIVRRAIQLATSLREFDETPGGRIIDAIGGFKAAEASSIIEFETGIRNDKVLVDLKAVRRFALEQHLDGSGTIMLETGHERAITWPLDSAETKRLHQALREQAGFVAIYASSDKIAINFVAIDRVMAAVAVKPDYVDIYYRDGSKGAHRTDRRAQVLTDLAAALKTAKE